MKIHNYRVIFCFLFCCMGSIFPPATKSSAQIPSETFTCDSVSPTSPASMIIAAYQQGDCLEEISDIDSAKKLVQLLNLDVIKYFDLGGLYDTEEKQNEYKQTKGYKDNLASLSSLRNQTLKTTWYSVLTEKLGRYSWEIKGYKFDMDKLTTSGGLTGVPPPAKTMFYDIDLHSLPFEVTGGKDQDVALIVNPDSGMSIDRHKDSVITIVFYKLGKVVEKEYSYYNEQCHCDRKAKEEIITTLFDRVIIFNLKTNEYYFDEIYDRSAVK